VAYNGVFMLLYDQRTDMVQVGVDEDEVLSLVDDIYDSARTLDVKKEQTKKLQTEIVDNYTNYREAIERAYTNAQNRKVDSEEGGQE
jgi:hypoxanthine phosphoribosyltransferase